MRYEGLFERIDFKPLSVELSLQSFSVCEIIGIALSILFDGRHKGLCSFLSHASCPSHFNTCKQWTEINLINAS